MVNDRFHRTALLAAFSCLGDKCEDTCCQGWSMRVDEATLSRYQTHSPELLAAVADDGFGGCSMVRDQENRCVKLESGWCGIQKRYGEDFLGDACYLYPRVTRRLGNETVMTATLSCPEIMRIALLEDNAFSIEARPLPERLPHTILDYAVEGITAEQALAIHQAFVEGVADTSVAPERHMARIVSLSHSLTMLPAASWAEALPFYQRMVDGRLPQPESLPADTFNLLHALMGLISAVGKPVGKRLAQTVEDMELALDVTLDWQNLAILTRPGSAGAAQKMVESWEGEWATLYAPYLRRWIAAQLSVALFPFAGFGNDLKQRAIILAVRFSTLRLALMAACHVQEKAIDDGQVIRIAQSLSRSIDHLADPTFSLQIYTGAGWARENRLRALVGDK